MKTLKPMVFVVDDNEFTAKQIKRNLEQSFPCEVLIFSSATDVLRNLYREPKFVLSDYQLSAPGETGLNGEQLLIYLKERKPQLPVLMYSSRNSIALAVRLIKHGAADFIHSDSTRSSRQFMYLLTKRIKLEREKLHSKSLERQINLVGVGITAMFVITVIVVSSTKPDMLPSVLLGFLLVFGTLYFAGIPQVIRDLRLKRKHDLFRK